MTDERRSFLRRNRWLMWLGGGLLVALAVVAVLVAVALHRAEPFLQARIVQALQEHFHARVELDSFHASLVEGVVAEGKGLRIWPPGHGIGGTEQGTAELGEPLIRLDEFRFHAPLRYKPGEPIHIQVLELKGMDIRIPPRQQSTRTAQGGRRPAARTARQPLRQMHKPGQPHQRANC